MPSKGKKKYPKGSIDPIEYAWKLLHSAVAFPEKLWRTDRRRWEDR